MNGPLEYRAAKQLGVNFPERTIELVVMPYEEETLVEHRGRMVTEIVSRGAFDGIQRRPNRIKVNRDHDIGNTCGKTLALHPGRDEGLVAEIYISRSNLGEETLLMADEGILDASAGFRPMPDGEKWETRSRRRLTKCWLAHIAMTPDPAYESARVLSVRQSGLTVASDGIVAARPNLREVRALRRQDLYDQMCR